MSDNFDRMGNVSKRLVEKPLKVIPTQYAGITYRSRTEARWAVFFDTLEVNFQYEAEGFDLDGVWYLPDFFIAPWDIYIEVKGSGHTLTTVELRKAERCAQHTGKPVLVVFGDPRADVGLLFWPDGRGDYDQYHAVIRTCRECDSSIVWYQAGGDWMGDYLGMSGYGQIALGRCGEPDKCADKFSDDNKAEKLCRARNAACNFRFDNQKKSNKGAV